MEDDVYTLHRSAHCDEIAQIAVNELTVVQQMRNVRPFSCREIVQDAYFGTLSNQGFSEVRTDESRASGH